MLLCIRNIVSIKENMRQFCMPPYHVLSIGLYSTRRFMVTLGAPNAIEFTLGHLK